MNGARRQGADDAGCDRGDMCRVECCTRCLAQGVNAAHIIDGRQQHSLLMEMLTDEGEDLYTRHLVFQCPELECFRQQWSHLCQGPRTTQAFMWQDDKIGIARFINACLRKTREGRSSHQPGVAGRDVI